MDLLSSVNFITGMVPKVALKSKQFQSGNYVPDAGILYPACLRIPHHCLTSAVS